MRENTSGTPTNRPALPAAGIPYVRGNGAMKKASAAEIRTDEKDLLTLRDPVRQDYERRTIALASAAHELKTPLSIMAGYTELLLDEKLGELNDRQLEVLREMQANAERLQR